MVTVLVNPASFGGYRSTDGVYSMLQASGMVVYTVNNGDDLTAALSQGSKQSGKYTFV